jgi:hypothetical protein
MGGPGNKCITARAMHAHFVISGMDGCFHSRFRPQHESLDSTGMPQDSATVQPSRRTSGVRPQPRARPRPSPLGFAGVRGPKSEVRLQNRN